MQWRAESLVIIEAPAELQALTDPQFAVCNKVYTEPARCWLDLWGHVRDLDSDAEPGLGSMR